LVLFKCFTWINPHMLGFFLFAGKSEESPVPVSFFASSI